MKLIGLPFLALAATAARAHDGHGFDAPHWHATDAWGFVIGAALVGAAALWWRGRK